MQSNGDYGSMPTLDSTCTSSSYLKETSTADIELNTVLDVDVVGSTKATRTSGVYVVQKRGKTCLPQKFDFLFKKTCLIYTLIIAGIWIMYTIPIIVFYASNITVSEKNATKYQNNTSDGAQNATDIDVECSEDFFFDNSSGVCRPECGRWEQYSPSTRNAVYGTTITFAILTIVICVTTIVWSIVRYKIMFRFPNIVLVYISISRIVLSVIHVVGYVDEKALYCTSRDRVTSFEEGSIYCNIIGAATTFVPTHDMTALCFQLGTVLFTVYFPFRARVFESKGWYKYIHIAAVANAVLFSATLVGIQYGLGGYSRTSVPIFCLADPSSAFVFAVIPACLINATFLTLVVLLLFKIFDIGGWKLKTKPNTQGADSPNTHYTSAQVKLVFTFFAYGIANIINFSGYSVVLRREDAFSQALEEYFDCESTGMVIGKSCDRSIFEEINPSRITFPLTIVSYMFLPLATLIYVANGEKLMKKYWQKMKAYKPERNLRNSTSI